MPSNQREYSPGVKRTRSVNDPTVGLVHDGDKPVGEFYLRELLKRYSVYFLRADKHVKIGYAKDLAQRIGSIQVSNPYEIKIAAVLMVDTELSARRIEAALHKRGEEDGKRARNEWFELTDRDVVNLVKWAKSYYPDHIFKAAVTIKADA